MALYISYSLGLEKFSFLLIAILTCFAGSLFAQHLKKDGTPDKRYKENKISHLTSTSSSNYTVPSTYTENSTLHLKKDGTPDRRFKENKTSTASWGNTNSIVPKYSKTNTTPPTFNKILKYSYVTERDANGKIKRSHAAKLVFMKQTGYPHGRPGYVIDHITPLKKGGLDIPSNMQWQTIADARAKDKWE